MNPPITNTAVSGMPRSQAGVAAAVASTSRQIGSSLGVAVSGTVVAASVTVATGVSAAWWVVAAATLVIAIVGMLATTSRARVTADRVADLFAEEPTPARL